MSLWSRQVITTEFVSESAAFGPRSSPDTVIAGPALHSLDGSSVPFRSVEPAWLPRWGGGPGRQDPHAHLRQASGLPPQYRASTYDWLVEAPGSDEQAILSIGMHTDEVLVFVQRGDGWEARPVVPSGIHESAQPVRDIEGRLVGLATVPRKPQVMLYVPSSGLTSAWEPVPVGGAGGGWHGLGAIALDGAQTPSIVVPTAVYDARDEAMRRWAHTSLAEVSAGGKLREGLTEPCIIHGHDFVPSVTTLFGASPHGRGVWRWDLEERSSGRRIYRRTTLHAETSQTHALALLDSRPDEDVDLWLVSGKRVLAHGEGQDPGWDEAPLLFRIGVYADPARPPRYEVIDRWSGVGLRIDCRRLPNGAMQIVTSNKLGVYCMTEETS